MTREEKELAVEKVLARYTRLGETIVSDEQILCRLLGVFDFSKSDQDIGEYLCSFLVP